MKLFFTKEQEWLDRWDAFLLTENHGSHLIYSDWLKSYESYGFDFEVLIVLKKDKVIGGFGAIIAKKLFFKFYIIPHGPVVTSGYERQISSLVAQIKIRAKKYNCCYAQFSLPISQEKIVEKQVYNHSMITSDFPEVFSGKKFKYIYCSYGINWVSFYDSLSPDDFIEKMSVQVRRNIKLAYKNSPEITFAKSDDECEKAYKLIEENAKNGNYSVRSYSDFKKTFLSLLNTDKCYFIVAKINGEIKGVGFFVKCGNYITYISGGTSKEKPDLKLGYLIHWEAIKISMRLGYGGYNISMGGSPGVIVFKSKFNTKTIYFEEPHHFMILNPFVFNLFKLLNIVVAKNKSYFNKLWSTIKIKK